jgi:hypothetical protein
VEDEEAPFRVAAEAPEAPEPRERRRKRKRSRDTSYRSSGGGIAVHPSIVTGLLMMVGAVVWFVLGLMAGWIYFYPPVLFVLGIGAVVRGFMGAE